MSRMVIAGVVLGVVIGGAGVYALKNNPAEAATVANAAKAGTAPAFKSDADKALYAAAARSASQLRNAIEDVRKLGVVVDEKFLTQGFADGIANKIALTDEQMQAAMQAFSTDLQARQQADAQKKTVENKAKGDAYLAETDKKDGWKKTASGLRYKVVQEGDGKTKATPADTVVVHYTGTLIDGTKFDSSVDRGQPAEFTLSQLVAGWIEGIQLMSKGAKYQMVIPAELAWGERGSGDKIGPNATVLFDVELVDVKAAATK